MTTAAALEIRVTREELLGGELAGGAADILTRLVDAVRSPVQKVQVRSAARGGLRGATLWVGRERVVLHPEGAAGVRLPVVCVGLALLPGLVARTVDLGPRPVAPEGFIGSVSEVTRACLGETDAPWTGPSEDPRLWRVRWDHGQVGVLDLGGGGLLRSTESAAGETAWVPTSAGEVWTALGALFAKVLPDMPLASSTDDALPGSEP